MTDLIDIASQFSIPERITAVKPLGEGFINDTYKVYVEGSGEPSYILQRKNHVVFPDVPAMMDNIKRVTEHIKTKVSDPLRETLTVIPARDGRLYHRSADGNYWAVCLYIGGTISYDRADSEELAYQGGLGTGLFHLQLSDFHEPLAEIIKGFHNIRFRLGQWDESVRRDAAGRVAGLSEEISWINDRRERMLAYWKLYETGVLPARVTHNDTKISNFLFNAADNRLLCAIDLDTLMTSTLLNDTGDALRAYTNTGAEDDENLDNVSMSMPMFKAYIRGYLEKMGPYLTGPEIRNLAFSGVYLTYEQVLRFLMDYIDGDVYYKTRSPQHNLIRTRAQYKLLTSMEEQLDEMDGFVFRTCSASGIRSIG